MNKPKKIIFSLISVMLVAVILCGIPVSAYNYPSFQVRNGEVDTSMIKQRATYTAEFTITGVSLGISDFNAPKDFCVHGDEIYILDSGNSRIVVLNSDYSLNRLIEHIYKGDQTVDLSESRGIFVGRGRHALYCRPRQGKGFDCESVRQCCS